MQKIKVAIAGVGNCASSLIQGFFYYQDKTPEDAIGLMHWEIGGYKPSDIQVVAAFDIDKRKVGKDISEAIFAPPNCTQSFYPQVPNHGVSVHMGRILDGFSEHMRGYKEHNTFVPADEPEPDKDQVVAHLQERGGNAPQLPSGWIGTGGQILCPLRPGGWDWICQQHAGVHC